jgi:hypothetical protein
MYNWNVKIWYHFRILRRTIKQYITNTSIENGNLHASHYTPLTLDPLQKDGGPRNKKDENKEFFGKMCFNGLIWWWVARSKVGEGNKSRIYLLVKLVVLINACRRCRSERMEEPAGVLCRHIIGNWAVLYKRVSMRCASIEMISCWTGLWALKDESRWFRLI